MNLLIPRSFLTFITLSILLAGCSYLPHKTPDTAPENNPIAATPIEPIKILMAGQNKDGSYNNLWDRVRNGYGLPAVSDNQVSKDLQWYTKNQRFITRATNQSQPYLHHVITQLEANGLPLEIALIPIIESAYDPTVTSPTNNVGIWQFALQTARNFGLKQNTFYNGRKDVVASTDAVIRYMKKLYPSFNNDWLLVIAAYNSGEGTVSNAIAKNKRAGKPTDFWSLPLPKHTQEYIPKLIALSKIIANPQRYNVAIEAIPDTPYFVEINVAAQINILQAAQQADMNADKLKKLNSGLNSWFTAPDMLHSILVPVADADAFSLQLASLPKLNVTLAPEAQNKRALKPTVATSEYKVKAGDNLSSIAKAHKISVTKLMQLNNLTATSTLKAGQKLRVS